jgi:hypothetical protein
MLAMVSIVIESVKSTCERHSTRGALTDCLCFLLCAIAVVGRSSLFFDLTKISKDPFYESSWGSHLVFVGPRVASFQSSDGIINFLPAFYVVGAGRRPGNAAVRIEGNQFANATFSTAPGSPEPIGALLPVQGDLSFSAWVKLDPLKGVNIVNNPQAELFSYGDMASRTGKIQLMFLHDALMDTHDSVFTQLVFSRFVPCAAR